MENESITFNEDFNFLIPNSMDLFFDSPSQDATISPTSDSPTVSDNSDQVNFTFFNGNLNNSQQFYLNPENQGEFSINNTFQPKIEPNFDQVVDQLDLYQPSPEMEEEEEEKVTKRKRKRAKKEETAKKETKKKESNPPVTKKIRRKHPEMNTAVTLSREKLLTTSSEEFQKWVDEIKKQRALTQEEIKDIRRQKRLIKNRESAQASRDRKKTEFNKLEEEISKLKQQRDSALRELSEIKSRMQHLETENNYMKSTMQQTGLLNNVYEGLSKVEYKNEKLPLSKNVKTAGICLFILIFSFGLFFNIQNGITSNQYKPISSIPKVQVAYSPSPSLNSLGTHSRNLLTKARTQIASNLQERASSSKILQANNPIPVYAAVPVSKMEEENSNNVPFQSNNASFPKENENVQSDVHLYCLNAKEYSVNNSKEVDLNNFFVSVMIPKSSLSSNSKIISLVNPNDDLVEMKCKVLPYARIEKVDSRTQRI